MKIKLVLRVVIGILLVHGMVGLSGELSGPPLSFDENANNVTQEVKSRRALKAF